MSEIHKTIYLYRDTDYDLVDCLHRLFERAAELFDQGEGCVRISVGVPQASEYVHPAVLAPRRPSNAKSKAVTPWGQAEEAEGE